MMDKNTSVAITRSTWGRKRQTAKNLLSKNLKVDGCIEEAI
jgi:hypothetical protein